jgi:carbonyl reductase 1
MRRILVTGANKGIGRALVAAILEQADDTHVYLGARDLKRGDDARASIVDAHPRWANRVEVLQLDVANDASVAQAANQLAAKLGGEKLYGVVNNAGIGNGALPTVLDVNTRGIKRVCEAMLPLLAPDGRVVNVTSASGPSFVAKCDDARKRLFTDPNVKWEEIEAVMTQAIAIDTERGSFSAAGLGDGEAYGLSKACANAFTLVFARKHPGLHVNACTPGFIETDLTRPYVESSGKSAKEMGMKSPAEGTRAPMHLLFGALDGNGRYYGSDTLRSPLDKYRAPGSPAYTGP